MEYHTSGPSPVYVQSLTSAPPTPPPPPQKSAFTKLPYNMHTEAPGCVRAWLDDLCARTEMECMCVLQGKSLSNQTTELVFHANKSVKDYIDSVKTRAHLISGEFAKLFRKIEKERWKQVKSYSLRLTCHVRSLLHECNTSILDNPPGFTEIQQRVMEESARLIQYVELHIEANGHIPDRATISPLLSALGRSFGQLVDLTLGVLVKKLISGLVEFKSHVSVLSTINHLLSLSHEGDHMCYIIAREGGVHKLLDVCDREHLSSAHAPALRSIAAICCVPESVAQLEQAGGIGILTDILTSQTLSEVVRSEAAGVIAQVTSPCVDNNNAHLTDFIENMDDLVRSLTDLCSSASNPDVFILGAAAIANITFMDTMSCDYLLRYNTLYILCTACLTSKRTDSMFAKDQVATVIANVASVEMCMDEIVINKGLDLLVQLLHIKQTQCHKTTEQAACERMHQKVAIALTRLARVEKYARQLVDLGVIPRLVQLCRSSEQRNHSDAILVASLAALRKICHNTNTKVEGTGLKELIQPKLMDSFLICSGLEESFV